MSLQKHKPIVSKAIRNSARGEECDLRFPWCNSNPETVVWCHSPYNEDGGGMAVKASEPFGCYGCSSCHDVLDGRTHAMDVTSEIRYEYFHRAFKRSLRKLIDKGIVVINGAA